MDIKQEFEQEQSELLRTILWQRFFKYWRIGGHDSTSLRENAGVEIYITNRCNQHCEYCYLTQYPELYPEGISVDTIKNNLHLLYDYFLEHNYNYIPRVDFFSGEIWHTQLGWDILEITKEYILKGLHISYIMIPSNMSFLLEDKTLQRIQSYIDDFRNNLNCNLCFSASCDGKIIEQLSRPNNNIEITKDDSFWDTLFSFCKHNGYGFHPMIASSNVKYWKENYDWWKQQLNDYDYDGYVLNHVMALEVRNPDWTEETINQYNELMNYIIDDYITHYCNHDAYQFIKKLFQIRDETFASNFDGYIPYILPCTNTLLGCSVDQMLIVRLGDLAIIPCHRTGYNKYIYGHFVVEDNHIISIKANNVELAIKIYFSNTKTALPKCDTCIFNDVCIKGCYGSNLEHNKDPFFQQDNICKFLQAKYINLMKKYESLGAIELLKSMNPSEFRYEETRYIVKLYDALKQRGDI